MALLDGSLDVMAALNCRCTPLRKDLAAAGDPGSLALRQIFWCIDVAERSGIVIEAHFSHSP